MVDELEERYPRFDGLNLTFETREGILKHCSRANARAARGAPSPAAWARRFLDRTQPSLEAQLCNLADEIAYNAHDIDDGVRSGLITLEQLARCELFERFHRARRCASSRSCRAGALLYEAIRRMLSAQVYDVIDATRAALDAAAPATRRRGARAAPPLVRFSEAMRAQSARSSAFCCTTCTAIRR